MCDNKGIDPMLGIREVLKAAGCEVTALFEMVKSAIVELKAGQTSLEFEFSTIAGTVQHGEKIDPESLFAAVKHCLKVARVKIDAAGNPLFASAAWESPNFTAQFDASAAANTLNEAEQLRQLWMGDLEYFAEAKSINKVQAASLLGGCGCGENCGCRSVGKYFHLDGAYTTNKAILTLPAAAITTDFTTATPADEKLYVKLDLCGYEMKGMCNKEGVRANLFKVPNDCPDVCNTNSSSGGTAVFGLTV